MNDTIETFDHNGFTIELHYDPEPMNPREECANLGTMFCQHNRYNLGDGNAELPSEDDIVLPLYLYDHSGLTMNTTGFHCPWDSGQVGYIYATKDAVRAEYGVKRISRQLIEHVLNVLRGEVECYDKYLRGEAYGYTVTDADDNEVDSCWGFDDLDYCREQAVSYVDYNLERAA